MGFEKAIEHNKIKRKSYRGSKSFDYSCRNHGTCEWCKGNRTYKNVKRELQSKEYEKED